MSRLLDETALATLSEADRAEAHRRWLVLRAHFDDGVPLTHVAAQSGIPHRTLQRWLARYRAGGLTARGALVPPTAPVLIWMGIEGSRRPHCERGPTAVSATYASPSAQVDDAKMTGATTAPVRTLDTAPAATAAPPGARPSREGAPRGRRAVAPSRIPCGSGPYGQSRRGTPLPEAVRTDMEQRFNHDFSRVRIQTTGPGPARASASDAAAYTMGADIVFAPGNYAPASPQGRQLLAHELAHVVQQSRGRVAHYGAEYHQATASEQLAVGNADLAEHQAVAAGRAFAADLAIPAVNAVPGPVVQCAHAIGRGTSEPGSHESAAELVIETVVEELLKTAVEKGLPLAKILVIAQELSKAFADGIGETLRQVNDKLSARYERDIVSSGGGSIGEITEQEHESLKDIRRWMAHSVNEFPGIVMGGMKVAAGKALEILVRELTIAALEKPMEKLAEKIGEMVIGTLKNEAGREAAEPAAYHTAEKAIRTTTEVIQEAFLKAAIAVAGKAVSDPGFKKEAEEAGFSREMVGHVAREVKGAKKLTFDNLQEDVHENVDRIRGSPSWAGAGLLGGGLAYIYEARVQRDLKEFDSAYADLALLVAKHTEMGRLGRIWHGTDAERLRIQMTEPYKKALGKLEDLKGVSAGVVDETLFDADMDLLKSTVGDLVK